MERCLQLGGHLDTEPSSLNLIAPLLSNLESSSAMFMRPLLLRVDAFHIGDGRCTRAGSLD